MLKTLLLLFVILTFSLSQEVKTPSDVYSQAYLLKQKVIYLREKAGIKSKFPTVKKQENKSPSHVLQKSLEVLSKINKYRINNNYGEISVPSYPSRKITPSDVYIYTKRLNNELSPFCEVDFLNTLKIKKFKNKTPSDVYQILWEVSLGFDKLLGIGGFTPTDVYEQSLKIVAISKFLRQSQGNFGDVKIETVKEGLQPNHALNTSYILLSKISKLEKKLWIKPAIVPTKVYKVTTPTQVYDSLQNIIAELQRLKTRLGLERYFEIEKVNTDKTPSDVVRNLLYAKELLPDFNMQNDLNQYDKKLLNKTPNEVYSLSEDILLKLNEIARYKGINIDTSKPQYIYNLKPKHVYQKSIEAIEKVIKFKSKEGFYKSNIPDQPFRKITPSEVYEQVERLNSIITLILKKNYNSNVKEYKYIFNKKKYSNKTPSDVYNNLWLISKILDQLVGTSYTPNETYVLARNIEKNIDAINKYFKLKNTKIETIIVKNNKSPKEVFDESLKLYETFKKINTRANIKGENIIIPKEKNTTPTTVYNALRIIIASLNEFMITYNIISNENVKYTNNTINDKTPTDVYKVIKRANIKLNRLLKDENY
jgi:hypothetical protein